VGRNSPCEQSLAERRNSNSRRGIAAQRRLRGSQMTERSASTTAGLKLGPFSTIIATLRRRGTTMPYDGAEATDRTGTALHFLAGKLATLGPRQREIARIVYSNAAVTPRQIQEQLSEQRSVRVIRTLLDRLVSKGLVRRRSTGRHREIIYIAAIPTPRVRDVAIQKLVNDRFGGSLVQAAMAMQELARTESRVGRRPPRTSTAVRLLASERPPRHAIGHR